MGTLFLVGLLVALLRRYALKRRQLTWKPIDLLLPVWLLLIGLTGFVVEGMRLAATTAELGYSPYWSPVGFFFSQGWEGELIPRRSVPGTRSHGGFTERLRCDGLLRFRLRPR
jgi:hypothetical protein